MKKSLKIDLNALLLIVLFILILSGLITVVKYNSYLSKVMAAAEEQKRPSSLEVLWIVDSECDNCADFQPFINLLEKNQNVEFKVKKIEYNSDLGKELVTKYKIEKVPNMIIKGETKRKNVLADWISLGRWQDDDFVFTSIKAPYRETNSGKIKGEFELIYLTKEECQACYDVTVHSSILDRLAMKPTNTVKLSSSSEKGKTMIEKYKIEKVPTIILKGDLSAFPQFLKLWGQVGSVEKDGSYIFRKTELMGGYWDFNKGRAITSPADK